MNSLMTKAEFAAHRGVGKSAVSNWAAAGHLVYAEDPKHPGKLLVDVARSEARINARVDPTRGRPTSGQAQGALALGAEAPPGLAGSQTEPPAPRRGDKLADVRTELLQEQKIKVRMENATRAGVLVPLEEYERRASELGRMARERMHALVRAQAERLAAETDPRAVTALLGAEIDRTFGELADQLEAGALDQAEVEPELGELEGAEQEEGDGGE